MLDILQENLFMNLLIDLVSLHLKFWMGGSLIIFCWFLFYSFFFLYIFFVSILLSYACMYEPLKVRDVLDIMFMIVRMRLLLARGF